MEEARNPVLPDHVHIQTATSKRACVPSWTTLVAPGWIVIGRNICHPSQLLGRLQHPPCRGLDVQVEVEGEAGVILERVGRGWRQKVG